MTRSSTPCGNFCARWSAAPPEARPRLCFAANTDFFQDDFARCSTTPASRLRLRTIEVFYLQALAPLGYALIMEVQQDENDSPAAGFGANGKPDLWIGGEGGLQRPIHIAVAAPNRAAVDAFHRAALAAGGKYNGAALPSELLRGLRARSRRPQYRGRVSHAGVSPVRSGLMAESSVCVCAVRACAAAAR
jgi:hypothetical protein